MDGLIVKKIWLDLILSGEKTWELRGSRTQKRGQIALIQSGSGLIMGVCNLVEVRGPLSIDELEESFDKHRVPIEYLKSHLSYENTFAWILRQARRLSKPIPYKHPSGAVIWVKLPAQIKFDQ
jgi:hypothetical protein